MVFFSGFGLFLFLRIVHSRGVGCHFHGLGDFCLSFEIICACGCFGCEEVVGEQLVSVFLVTKMYTAIKTIVKP